MKHIFTSLFLIITFSVNAQTTFTQSLVPSIGQTFSYKISKYNSSMGNLTNTKGPAVAWNFNYLDSLVSNVAQTLNINFLDTVGKPNEAGIWPAANMSSNEGTSLKFSFYTSDATAWSYVGEAFYALGAYQYTAYDSTLDIMHFPMSFTNSSTDTSTGSWVYSSNNMARNIRSTTTYDGYGTLSINGVGAYSAHRIYTKENIIDNSVQVGGLPITVNTKRKIYSFYDGVNNQPMIQVLLDSSHTTGAINTTLNSERILVNSTILGLKEAHLNTLNVYPNPVTDVLSIELNNIGATVVSICDITGQVIERNVVNASNNRYILNVANLTAGIYFIKTECKGTVSQQKFVKL